MRAGLRDRSITIEQRSDTPNAQGGVGESWSTFDTVWAQKIDLRGREDFQAKQLDAEITTRWRILYLSGLRNDMRIVYEGVTYDIFEIKEVGRKKEMDITSKAKKA